MTKKQTTSLTVEELLQDDRFILAVFNGPSSVKAYQKAYLRGFGDVENTVEDARLSVLAMRQHFAAQSPSQETLEGILEKIRSS